MITDNPHRTHIKKQVILDKDYFSEMASINDV